MKEVAAARGIDSYLIDEPEEITPGWVQGMLFTASCADHYGLRTILSSGCLRLTNGYPSVDELPYAVTKKFLAWSSRLLPICGNCIVT